MILSQIEIVDDDIVDGGDSPRQQSGHPGQRPVPAGAGDRPGRGAALAHLQLSARPSTASQLAGHELHVINVDGNTPDRRSSATDVLIMPARRPGRRARARRRAGRDHARLDELGRPRRRSTRPTWCRRSPDVVRVAVRGAAAPPRWRCPPRCCRGPICATAPIDRRRTFAPRGARAPRRRPERRVPLLHQRRRVRPPRGERDDAAGHDRGVGDHQPHLRAPPVPHPRQPVPGHHDRRGAVGRGLLPGLGAGAARSAAS